MTCSVNSKKMSEKSKFYNKHEVNKKILKKYTLPRSESDILGPYDRFRDENLKIYNEKKDSFQRVVKIYNDFNKTAINICKKTPQCDINGIFLKKLAVTERDDLQNENETNSCSDGVFVRKRTRRRIHEIKEHENQICSLEPWFRRYLILSKFIYLARNVILRNRLLKNLETLKKLDKNSIETYEKGRKYENVSYSELFEKFVN